MRAALGLAWFASANAAVLCSAVHGHQASMAVARATPARARLGHPSGSAGDAPDSVPDKFEELRESGARFFRDLTEDQDLRFLRQLDALKPTLSYLGWQKDLKMAESYFVSQAGDARRMMAEMRRKQLLHDHKRGPHPPLPPPPPLPQPPPPPPPLPPASPPPVLPDDSCFAWESSSGKCVDGGPQWTTGYINEEGRLQATDPTRSAAMPAASLGPTKYNGYELSYSDAGTLQIYIPAEGATVQSRMSTTVAAVNLGLVSAAMRRVLMRAVGPQTAAVSTVATFTVFLSAYVFKIDLIEPATDTTITIGKYEWTVVRRTMAGVVILDKQGATDQLRRDWSDSFAAYTSDSRIAPEHREWTRTINELDRAGVYAKSSKTANSTANELLAKVDAHLQGLTLQHREEEAAAVNEEEVKYTGTRGLP